MNGKFRLTLIAVLSGAVLAIIVAVSFNFDPYVEKSAATKVACIILSVWLFFAPTSYIYVFNRLKKRAESESPEKAFRKGVFYGCLFGFELCFLPLIIAPVAAVLYFIDLLKSRPPNG